MQSYEFNGATLEVVETELTIRRGKLGGFGLPKELAVPLASVVGARFVQPKALSNGHLQVLVAGHEAPMLSAMRAANDAHTLIVTKKQSDMAASLADWLTSLAAYNQAAGLRAAASSTQMRGTGNNEPQSSGTPDPSTPRAATVAGKHFDLWGSNGWCGHDIVGESHRTAALEGLLSARRAGGQPTGELEATATLVREPGNPHDANAVRVVIDGGHVGYLRREDATAYAPHLDILQQRGQQARVPAVIGWSQDWDNPRRRIIGVRIDLGSPDRIVPANTAPTVPHVLLPHGRAIQAKEEDQNMDGLRAVMGRPEFIGGSSPVYATLAETAKQTASGPGRPLVEVRIDGQRAGVLTPQMSETLLSIVRYAADRGVELACRATVTGNSLAAEVVLYTARANELPEGLLAQIDGLASTAR